MPESTRASRLRAAHRIFAAGSAAVAAAAAILVAAGDAAAQAEITIRGTSKHVISVANFSGSGGADAANIVRADLAKSGFFNIAPNPSGVYSALGGVNGSALAGTLRSPDGKELFSRRYAGPDLRRNAHTFAADIVAEVTGVRGIANSQIAFVAGGSGNKEIYLCDYDGANVRKVTRDGKISVSPSISPDGSQIAYTSYRSGFPDIYLIDLRSGSRSRIINAPGTNSGAAISPDGKKIALTMSWPGNPELFVTGMGGGKGKRLTNTPGVESSPTWSPDGRSLIFTGDSGGRPLLYKMSSGGGGPQRLSVGYNYCTEPNWSPDGKRLAFNIRQGGSHAVAVYDFASGRSKIVASGGAEDPCWGPDSRHLVFAQSGGLVVLDVDSGARRSIVSGMGASEPSWTR